MTLMGFPISNLFLYFILYAFLGWVLEATTHVKYWDYSQYRFNLKGRVCLWAALTWGILSYIVIFFIHPPIQSLVEELPVWLEFMLCGAFLALLSVDAVFTIRNLVLVALHVASVAQLAQELQLQAALGKAELSGKLEDSAATLRERYRDQVAQLEKVSRRFRNTYSTMRTGRRYSVSHEDIMAAAALAKEELIRRKSALKSLRARH